MAVKSMASLGKHAALWSANAQAGKYQGPSITYWRQLGSESPAVQGNGRQEAKFSLRGEKRSESIHEDVRMIGLQI